MYEQLKSYGYDLIFKQTVKDSLGKPKGNVDAELVLHTMIEYPHFDKAIIVSGDGDFIQLVEYLKNQGKRVEVMAFGKSTSSHLREVCDEFIDLGETPDKFLLKK